MKIGITGPDERGEYARAIADAGGESVPLADDLDSIPELLETLGGVMLSGGHDVDPTRYGRKRDAAETYEPERDEFELALAKELRRRQIPTLAICRGLQLLNVAYGGTLFTDLHRDRHLDASAHRPQREGVTIRSILPAHVVTMDDGILMNALGRRFPTTSRHHQAIDRLAPDLRVVGRTSDNVVEAVESTFKHPFFAGVQWHPETSAVTQHDTPSRNLFKAFVKACVPKK